MKRKIWLITACITVSFIVTAVLFVLSAKPNPKQNGFNRTFSESNIQLAQALNLKFGDYYIAGFIGDNIYLANGQAPKHLIRSSANLKDTQHIQLSFVDSSKIDWFSYRLKVDSPYIYLLEGTTPVIQKCLYNDTKLIPFIEHGSKFNASLPISGSSLILKTYNKGAKQVILLKEMEGHKYTDFNNGLLSKQVDGQFCTEGSFNWDAKSSSVVYVYTYRNQFFRADSNLNIVYSGNTIDTNYMAKITVATLDRERKNILSSLTNRVNVNSYVADGRIYVQSALIADNEEVRAFHDGSVFDVYSLKSGKYKFSFYLPNNGKVKIGGFAVRGNSFYAMYNSDIRRFLLNFKDNSVD